MTIKIIDKSEDIKAILSKYKGEHFRNPDAVKEIAELWGLACNDAGVALTITEEILVEVGQCQGILKYAETSKGYFLIGLSAKTAIGGFGYAPSIWSRTALASYWDAREFAVQKLIDYFEKESVTKNSCAASINKQNAKKAADRLRGELTPQLSLF